MASREMNASWGRKTSWKNERRAACCIGRAVVSGYCSVRLARKTEIKPNIIDRIGVESANTIHSRQKPGNSNHPPTINDNIAGLVRLRRKLSKIFQRSRMELS